MPHISGAVRDFLTPVNRTDLRSFMALVQQVSYTTAVAPKLHPFRELLKETVPLHWSESIDRVFQETRTVLADNVEDGIKSFDPSKPIALLSDWCHHGVGYLLLQKHCPCPPKYAWWGRGSPMLQRQITLPLMGCCSQWRMPC